MNLYKRIEKLEITSGTVQLRWPGFLLEGMPDHLRAFHDSGQLAKYVTMHQAYKAWITGTIYETMQEAYREQKKNESYLLGMLSVFDDAQDNGEGIFEPKD